MRLAILNYIMCRDTAISWFALWLWKRDSESEGLLERLWGTVRGSGIHVLLYVCMLHRICNVFHNALLKRHGKLLLHFGTSLHLKPSQCVVIMGWLVYLAFRLLLSIRDGLAVLSCYIFHVPDWAEGPIQQFGLRVIYKIWYPMNAINSILHDLELQLRQTPGPYWLLGSTSWILQLRH